MVSGVPAEGEHVWLRADGHHIVQAVNSVVAVVGGHQVRLLEVPASRRAAHGRMNAARLLRASSAIVDFVDRAGLLADLAAWARAPEPFAVRVVGGVGGSGKTRLSVELCHQLGDVDVLAGDAADDRWLAGFLHRDATDESLTGLAHVPVGRLVVVDYAEARTEQVGMLLSLLAERASVQAPVRVVLLVRRPAARRPGRRTAGSPWVDAVRPVDNEVVDRLLDAAEADQIVLDDLALTRPERGEVFEAAVAAFRDPHLSGALAVAAPDLGLQVFDQPLMVVFAGFLAAAGGPGAVVPATAIELFDAVLEHEENYWLKVAATTRLDLTRDEMGEAAAVATLVEVGTQEDALELLRLLPPFADAKQAELVRLDTWLRLTYPPASGGGARWGHLEPDRLGEHLIARLGGNAGPVLAWALAPGRDADLMLRTITTIGRAFPDHPVLYPPVLAVLQQQLGALVEAAVAQAQDPSRYRSRSTPLPGALASLVDAVGRDLAPGLLRKISDDLPRRNPVLAVLALQVSATLVELHRVLAEDDLAAHAPTLAASLNNYAIGLAAVGRREEALAPAREALDLSRALAGDDPAAYAPDLAASLNTYAVRLAAAGRHEEALCSAKEALDLRRALAEDNPAAYIPDLAASLNNYAIGLAAVGRDERALASAREALDLFRALAKDDPAAHTPTLAASLNTYAIRLAAVGRNKDALAPAEESVDLRRALADTNPATYTPDLASSQNNYSVWLGAVGRHEEALASAEEALGSYRALAEDNPAAHTPNLASSLNNYAIRLAAVGRGEEALASAKEALELRRALAEDNPAAYIPELAASLNNYAIGLAEVGRQEEADAIRAELANL